jgi:hypothetical protein
VRDLAERWLKSVPTLREPQMRAALVGADLAAEDLDRVAEALEHVALLAEQADERAREVLGAATPYLGDRGAEERVDALREVARRDGLLALERLLRRRPAPELSAPEPGQRGAADLRAGRALSLGERKALARRPDRFTLDRLLRDPHPHVIRTLLANPRVTEDDVVRLAAKRPTYGDLQSEIAKSPRWSIQPRVRLALVQNPFTPAAIAVPLLPLLVRSDLAQVAQATDLPAVVRAGALDLLERRPPLPSTDADPSTQ